MKRVWLALAMLAFCGTGHAEQLREQFRVWKSSALQGGNYNPTLLSTSPIIFHTVIGSPTVNQGDNSYFVLLRSTRNPVTTNVSTKAFINLNTAFGGPTGIGNLCDVFSDSNTFYSKQGGAIINIEWDYYSKPPWDLFPKD